MWLHLGTIARAKNPRRKERVPQHQPALRHPRSRGRSASSLQKSRRSPHAKSVELGCLLLRSGQSWCGRVSGPVFGFSDTWQLVINTGTTIVTFLMVFLIQNSQNRDFAAIQVKLDELIRVSKANNAFMGLEHLTDEELEDIEGKDEGRAKAVLEARQASKDAKHKLRVIEGDG